MAIREYERRKFMKEMILSRHHRPGAFPMVLILDHMKASHNVGKIIRTANVLGVREVHLVGIEKFNLRTCRGAFQYTRTRPFETFAQSYESLLAEGYSFFALSPYGESTMGTTPLPERSAFIVGHEEFGLSFEPATYPGVKKVRIPQFGNVESLNASIAASISCFEYLRQREFIAPAEVEPYVAPPPPVDGLTDFLDRLETRPPA